MAAKSPTCGTEPPRGAARTSPPCRRQLVVTTRTAAPAAAATPSSRSEVVQTNMSASRRRATATASAVSRFDGRGRWAMIGTSRRKPINPISDGRSSMPARTASRAVSGSVAIRRDSAPRPPPATARAARQYHELVVANCRLFRASVRAGAAVPASTSSSKASSMMTTRAQPGGRSLANSGSSAVISAIMSAH